YAPDLASLSFPTRRSSDLREVALGCDERVRGFGGRGGDRFDRGFGLVELVEKALLQRRVAATHADIVAQPLFVIDELRALLLERSEEHTSELQSRERLVCR